jgi:hypothetical protein
MTGAVLVTTAAMAVAVVHDLLCDRCRTGAVLLPSRSVRGLSATVRAAVRRLRGTCAR